MRNKIIIGLCILILISGCYQKAELKKEYKLQDFVSVLEANKDFQDFNSDFKNANGRDFEAVEVEIIKLTKESIEERKNHFESNITTSPFNVIYDDLPDKSGLFEVWLKDKVNENRKIISVIDMEQNNVLKFYALISITDKISLER